MVKIRGTVPSNLYTKSSDLAIVPRIEYRGEIVKSGKTVWRWSHPCNYTAAGQACGSLSVALVAF